MNAPSGDAFPASLLLVGAGNMGGAMLRGWLDLGIEAARITVVEPHPAPDIRALCNERGVVLTASPAPASVIVLAVKPQSFDAVASALEPVVDERTLIISVLAGKTIGNIRDRMPSAQAVVRAMPNLAAAVRASITGAIANAAVTPAGRQVAETLLSAIGRVEWLADEGLIDAVTAVSGSGPAYVFYLAECLAKAGTEVGLPADIATRLARATIEGAGALLALMPEVSPVDFRHNVTSPGGTTAAALAVLMDDNTLARLISKAVAEAKKRAGELSG